MDELLEQVIPAGQIYIRESILKKGNILGLSESKAAWAKKLNLPRKAEEIFFAGCGYQFMRYAEGMVNLLKSADKAGLTIERAVALGKTFSKAGLDFTTFAAKLASMGREDPYTRVLTSAVNVLTKLELKVGYLYDDEPCCGSPLYYSGFVEDYVENATKNKELFESLGVKAVIGLIPACTSSLKNLYPKFVDGYQLQVKHFTEAVAERLKRTSVKLKLKEKLVITYHDPCQLSRYLDISDAPREIISSIDGVELREPEAGQCKRWSTCCGGGGLEISHPELSERLAINRIQELLATGASVVVTNCPSCMMQLGKAARKLGRAVKILDIAELIDQALERK